MPGASPPNDLAAGLTPTAEGDTGLTLTYHRWDTARAGWSQNLLSHANSGGVRGPLGGVHAVCQLARRTGHT